MAGKIAGLTPEHLEAIVAQAELSDPADATYLVETLSRRREKILAVAGLTGGGAEP